jgi:hypothetical protein
MTCSIGDSEPCSSATSAAEADESKTVTTAWAMVSERDINLKAFTRAALALFGREDIARTRYDR